MRDKLLQIRVDEDFLSKIEYLQKINGYKSTAETVRKILEKEFRKENNIPPHGDLIERDWVRDSINHSCWVEHNDYLEAIGIVDDAPTVIKATPEVSEDG